MEKKFIDFILENEDSDLDRLLLSSSKYPEIDMKKAVSTIVARKKIKTKVKSWYEHPALSYPFSLSIEQCSSEQTAIYKQSFVNAADRVCDLTGGMGIDSYFLSLKSKHLNYFERNKELCETTKYNFEVLGVKNVSFHTEEVTKLTLKNSAERYDLIYLDPARRANSGSRVYGISDCEPNILEIQEELFNLSPRILVKISPMVDISACIQDIKNIKEIHILAVDNECKETLLYIEKGFNGDRSVNGVEIFTTNFTSMGKQEFSFFYEQEKQAVTKLNNSDIALGHYLYEANKAITKSGAFKSVALHYEVEKLAKDSHLYVSSSMISDFPGRKFRILDVFDYHKKNFKLITEKYPRASVSAKNFPLSSDDLRKKLKLKESSTYYLFGTSDSKGAKKIIICSSVLEVNEE